MSGKAAQTSGLADKRECSAAYSMSLALLANKAASRDIAGYSTST